MIRIRNEKGASTTCKNSLAVHQKVKPTVHMNSNPRCIYPSKIKMDIQINTGVWTFVSASFTLAPKWKQLKHPNWNTELKMCHSHTKEEFIKQWRNEVLYMQRHGWTWKALCQVIESSHKRSYFKIPVLGNVQNRQAYGHWK